MLFYFSLMTSILGPTVTLTQQTVSGIWMFAVVLGGDLTLARVIGHPHTQSLLHRYLYLIERSAGAILLLFGLLVLCQSAESL